MITGLIEVSRQVLILFLLMLVGFVCTKRRFFSESSINDIAKFVLYTVTPCVIISSFNRIYNAELLHGLVIAAVSALGAHLLNILLAHTLVKDADAARQCVLRFGTVFSNCGYMALPLQQALLGSDGVFYGAAYIAVFNLINWTYGLFLMGGNECSISIKKIFLNPGVISVTIGLVLFLTPLSLPIPLLSAVQSLAALNTPLPMVIIGYYLAGITSLAVLKDVKLCLTLVLRLVVAPLLFTAVLYVCGIRGTVLTAMVIAASAPAAANTVMFSVIFKRDSKCAVTVVAVSTLFSILTMPLIIALAVHLGTV